MTIRHARFAPPCLFLFALPAIAACGGDARGTAGGWAGRVDTLADGRVVVENPADGAWGEGEGWKAVEELRIGSAEEDGPALFGQVAEVSADPAGRLWVLEAQADQIRVFDPAGSHVRTIGRKGAGPGEFGNVAGMDWSPDGRLWVLDNGNARFSVFDTAGALVTTHLRRDAVQMFPWDGGFDAGGTLYDLGSIMNADWFTHVLVRYGPGLAPRDTFRFPRYEEQYFELKQGGNRMRAAVPFAPRQVWARSRRTGGVWLGTSGEYRLHLLSFAGDTLRTIAREFTPRPVTAAEREQALEGLKSFRQQGGRVDEGRIPSTLPAFTRILEDDRGWLWVRPGQPQGQAVAFDVFDPEGRYQGQVSLGAARVEVAAIQGAYVYAVALDDLDVPYVVRYRLQGRE